MKSSFIKKPIWFQVMSPFISKYFWDLQLTNDLLLNYDNSSDDNNRLFFYNSLYPYTYMYTKRGV
ncbi:hypothetical protein [Virgibacillus pantothenticus]|uniref:hypothetical protein n=1 Tax=Virgibacillus pantothenticus TaxID=1473 RepID=UPI0009845E95|nr:hypothetical protein [Virgibacillus pantothenticus]